MWALPRNWPGGPDLTRRALLRSGAALACAWAFSLAAQSPPGRDQLPLVRPDVAVGDEWVFRRTSAAGARLMRQSITAVAPDSISLKTEEAGSLDSSVAVHDRHWGLLASGFNDYRPALAYYVYPLYPGKRWGIDSAVSNFGAGQSGRIRGEGMAIGWEEIVVPAGRFAALRVEVTLETSDPGDAARVVRVREVHWLAAQALRAVRVQSEVEVAGEDVRRETVELMSFRIE